MCRNKKFRFIFFEGSKTINNADFYFETIVLLTFKMKLKFLFFATPIYNPFFLNITAMITLSNEKQELF